MLHKNRVKNRTHMTSFQVIIISFFCLILVGTLLLMLPISSRQRCVTSFPDAMFTAVSATCVTGLVVKDTATYWSLFGQAVILMLIQIGGMGVITVGLAIIGASGRKIGLWQRSTMQESISAPQVGGIVKLTGFILKTSLIIEMIGAALLAPVFCNDLGIAKGLWYSVNLENRSFPMHPLAVRRASARYARCSARMLSHTRSLKWVLHYATLRSPLCVRSLHSLL